MERELFEQKILFEKTLKEQAEIRAEKAEAREKELLKQINNLTDTMKMIEAPNKRKKFF